MGGGERSIFLCSSGASPSHARTVQREMEETIDVSVALHGSCRMAVRLVSKII